MEVLQNSLRSWKQNKEVTLDASYQRACVFVDILCEQQMSEEIKSHSSEFSLWGHDVDAPSIHRTSREKGVSKRSEVERFCTLGEKSRIGKKECSIDYYSISTKNV